MGPGKPCHFVTKNGCAIYSSRPHDPCKGFKCIWKINPAVPLEFKPNLVDMIMIENQVDNMPFVHIVPAGKEISLEILDWAVSAVNAGSIDSIVYKKDGKERIISRNPAFIDKYFYKQPTTDK